MRYIFSAALVAAFTVACNAQPSSNPAKIMNKQDSTSYAIGVSIGKNMKMQDLPVNPAMVAAGMREAFEGKEQLTEEQMNSILQVFQLEMSERMQQQQAKKGSENLAKAEKFLNENKTKPGVMTTASGLQYRVITEGSGKKPTVSSTVKVHYTGTLIDGTKFDSSIDRGQPAEFGLNGVIPGWTEALQLMSVGSKYIVYLPPHLAYGEQGAGGAIGPNEALIFEIELLDIVSN